MIINLRIIHLYLTNFFSLLRKKLSFIFIKLLKKGVICIGFPCERMAFFGNHSDDTVSHGVLEEKIQGQSIGRIHSSAGNEDVDGTYSEREFDGNMGGQYQSDGEPDDSVRLHNDVAANNGAGVSNLNFQTAGRRIPPGKWGSTYWKDCQPMDHQIGSDSGQDSKSDQKNLDGSEYNSSDDRDGRLESEDDEAHKEVGKAQRGQSDVPADEMLSDEYYEQDGEEQSDTLHYGGFSNSVGLNTRPQSMPISVSTTTSRSSRALNNHNYYDEDDDNNNDDADADYEEEEEEDEDDPDDADFEPDFGVASGHAGNKVIKFVLILTLFCFDFNFMIFIFYTFTLVVF
ncbi:protein CHROMATIN REMODELING 5-like [Durio zibethinus]|uniref:Protein CHROMATIN REMODELING 5-like n=1 Tax=Durio zibethinus TaxID=66656 RepID=A0A6P5XT68_DURZI|nr:protein CHROMATIN REMODELING 5-like [Durio zibethinus]